ncbi:MAG: hypothetical protein HND44_10205 [Chloroflexi bacterium]|nr:hypothetical protein [Ardenticatenaceae bacterium]MBL1128851.1 hypothetical protein [Chloroflexota bacterium]NOG34928.1 hypothetical protein [Chloroflexota bacterium]
MEQTSLGMRIPAMIKAWWIGQIGDWRLAIGDWAISNRQSLKSLWLLFLLPLLFVLPAQAQDEPAPPAGLTLAARAGFDGLYKGEYWLPVVVSVANSGPAIEGEVRVYTGANTNTELRYRAPISLPTQSDKRVTLYIRMTGAASVALVQLADDDGQVIAQTRTSQLARVSADGLLYGVVSPDAGTFDFLSRVAGSRSDTAVAYLSLADLPDAPVAWNALDVLVLNDTDTTQFTADQLQALESWVNTGGQLVVTGGASWQKTAVPLADWLPISLTGSETVSDLPGLAEQTGVPFRDPGPYVVTTSSLVRGELLFHEAGLPLLAMTPYGRGAVYFLALDPRFAPLLDWSGAQTMFDAVAGRVPPLSLWGAPPFEGYAAQNAITRLPDLNLPSVWQLALFLLIYIAAVGPLNYLVLKRYNRLELAWVTLPTLILVFTAVTYFTGFQLRGREAIINQMAVAYSRAGSPQAQVYSLVGLYSPRRSTYDVIFPADTLARPFSGFSFNPNTNAEAITFSNDNSVDGVRVDVSEVQTLQAQTNRPALAIAGEGTLNRQGTATVRLQVAVQNNSAQTLESAVLLFNDTAVPLGDLTPGETENVNEIVSSGASSSLGYGGPLTRHANTLLGYDYYSSAKLYPRYDFMQSLEGESFSGGASLSLPRNSAVLVGWTEIAAIDIGLSQEMPKQTAVTLHFIEIPLSQNLTGNGANEELTLPAFLLDWKLLPDNTTTGSMVTPASLDLGMMGAQAGFEYTPPLEFQQIPVTGLTLLLEKENYSSSTLPEVNLWNWQTQTWELQEGVNWGRTAVANPTAYIGPANAIRLQLVSNDPGYQRLTAVYPLLTVKSEN